MTMLEKPAENVEDGDVLKMETCCPNCSAEYTVTGPGSPVAGGYAAQWQNEHPSRDEQGWYWYWHPDLGEPTPILVMWSADPEDYGWKYRPSKYPADENEWWLPMGYGPEGPELPSAA